MKGLAAGSGCQQYCIATRQSSGKGEAAQGLPFSESIQKEKQRTSRNVFTPVALVGYNTPVFKKLGMVWVLSTRLEASN